LIKKERPLPKNRRPVHDEGSILCFERYRDILKEKKFSPVNHTEIQDGDPTSEEHLLWMCEYCIPRVRDDGMGMTVDKYSRWLGYIQGCLIMRGYTTVEKERNKTREWFKRDLNR
jgi:hypothetical protein